MIITVDNIIGWKSAIFILLFSLFLIWLIFGGGDHEYIGLSPLEIGFDASRQKPHIDNTPEIPDLEKVDSEEYSKSFSMSVDEIPFSSFSKSFSKSFSRDCSVNTELLEAKGPHKVFNSRNKSKGELLCKQALEEIYGKPFVCVRPDFLKNPLTNRSLELDLYNHSLKLAVEYNAKQHYIYPNGFHKNEEEFIYQVRRDQFKVNTCDANGVYLISVPYNVPLDLESIKKYIIYYLPENAHLRSDIQNPTI